MLPFKTLIDIDFTHRTPVYRQIVDSIIGHIREGTIKPGVFLPSSRVMAELLQVHRNTITAAYDELAAQSWLISIPRKGIKVADDLPVLHPVDYQLAPGNQTPNNEALFFFEKSGAPGQFLFPATINKRTIVVNDGFPDVELAPIDLIMREYRLLLNNRKLRKTMYLKDPGGSPGLKLATRDFMNDSRGLNIGEENILITRGAQMAVYVAAAMILRPGDKVVVSEPNYFIANQLFERLGAQLVRVPVDENGLMVERIEEFVKIAEIRLIYVVPHHHHPTTVTLSPERRSLLLRLISEHNIPLIEDDYDYDFHYDNKPVLPLASGPHHGNVIYIGSYTKLLAPSFRIGYLIAAENFVKEATMLRRLMDLRGDVIMEEAFGQVVSQGDLGAHINRSLKIYRQRLDRMTELMKSELPGVVSFTPPRGGLALWVKFAPEFPLGGILEKAASEYVVMNGSAYYQNSPYNALRMGFASLKEADMEQVVAVIKKITR